MTTCPRPRACRPTAPGRASSVQKKGSPKGSPHSLSRRSASSRGDSPRRALNLPCVQATGAHLDLGDLAVDHNPGDLKIRLPCAPRLVVRMRDVVAVRDSLVAYVAA